MVTETGLVAGGAATLILGTAVYGVYLAGKVRVMKSDDYVDMEQVASWHRHEFQAEASQNALDDGE